MNKTYRSVWNESTRTYVAAQENASARGKKSSASRSAVVALVGLAALGAASAVNAQVVAGSGSMNLCNGNNGWGWSSSGANRAISNCQGLPAGNISFFLGNAGTTSAGGGGWGSSSARITGYTNGTLEFQSTNNTSMLNTVTMNSNKIISLAPGLISSSCMDAVNGSQLYGLSASTAAAMGGGSAVNTNGSISAPTYVVNGSTYNNVGGALTNLSGAVTSVTNTVNNINNGAGKTRRTSRTCKATSRTSTVRWESIERAQKLAQRVNGELDKCVPPAQPPPPPPPAELAKPVSLSADALFDFDSAVLKPEGKETVDGLAQRVRDSHVKLHLLKVDGYTDRFGSAAHNEKLSQQRA